MDPRPPTQTPLPSSRPLRHDGKVRLNLAKQQQENAIPAIMVTAPSPQDSSVPTAPSKKSKTLRRRLHPKGGVVKNWTRPWARPKHPVLGEWLCEVCQIILDPPGTHWEEWTEEHEVVLACLEEYDLIAPLRRQTEEPMRLRRCVTCRVIKFCKLFKTLDESSDDSSERSEDTPAYASGVARPSMEEGAEQGGNKKRDGHRSMEGEDGSAEGGAVESGIGDSAEKDRVTEKESVDEDRVAGTGESADEDRVTGKGDSVVEDGDVVMEDVDANAKGEDAETSV